VAKTGFLGASQSLSLAVGEEKILDVSLGALASISGTVVQSNTRESLPNVTIQAWSGGVAIASTTSNATGAFILENLSPGLYELRLTSQNGQYDPATYVIQILNNGTVSPSVIQVQMSLTTSGGVPLYVATGTIFDAYTKTPLEYVKCGLKGVGDTLTDASGKFRFQNLAQGKYEVTFTKLGYDAFIGNFQVASGGGITPSPLNFELVQTQESGKGSISGRFVNNEIASPPVGVADLVVRLYRIYLVEGKIWKMNYDDPVTVSHWTLEATPTALLTTRTSQDTVTANSVGTFRFENLSPTDATNKYLVYVGTGNATISLDLYHDPLDIGSGTAKFFWYMENRSQTEFRQVWTEVVVKEKTTTYLQNYQMPNF
jgi:hypothetical protein